MRKKSVLDKLQIYHYFVQPFSVFESSEIGTSSLDLRNWDFLKRWSIYFSGTSGDTGGAINNAGFLPVYDKNSNDTGTQKIFMLFKTI